MDFDFVSVVSYELETSPICIEHLATARYEARPGRVGGTYGVGDADIGRFRIGLGQLPGDSTGLGIQRQPDAPHYAGFAVIGDSAVFAHPIEWALPERPYRLSNDRAVEVVVGSANKTRLPPLGDVDEQDVKVASTCFKALNGPHQVVRNRNVSLRRSM